MAALGFTQPATGLDHPPLALLVDRDADTRHLYRQVLRLAHCDVDEAEDGREALAKAITEHPDVIVTETRLPGMSGFELCRLLGADPDTRDIPVIFVTADAAKSNLERAQAVGAQAVLVKPCLPEHVAKTIQALLARSREARTRSAAAHFRTAQQLERADELIDRSQAFGAPRILSRAHHRHVTTSPPLPPPEVVCPQCDQVLRYSKSHVGGVSERHQEQWDYFECPGGCGTFQYRQRTRKLRRVI